MPCPEKRSRKKTEKNAQVSISKSPPPASIVAGTTSFWWPERFLEFSGNYKNGVKMMTVCAEWAGNAAKPLLPAFCMK
jgi:hypothetical protein